MGLTPFAPGVRGCCSSSRGMRPLSSRGTRKHHRLNADSAPGVHHRVKSAGRSFEAANRLPAREGSEWWALDLFRHHAPVGNDRGRRRLRQYVEFENPSDRQPAGDSATKGATAIGATKRRRAVRSTSRLDTSEADGPIISPSSAGMLERVRCRD
jgi:hypothetical protein